MYVTITDRKRAEEALRESREKYRDLVESSTTGLASGRERGLHVCRPRTAGSLLGYEPEEIIGKNAF